jgi:hypothetical protein
VRSSFLRAGKLTRLPHPYSIVSCRCQMHTTPAARVSPTAAYHVLWIFALITVETIFHQQVSRYRCAIRVAGCVQSAVVKG